MEDSEIHKCCFCGSPIDTWRGSVDHRSGHKEIRSTIQEIVGDPIGRTPRSDTYLLSFGYGIYFPIPEYPFNMQ